MRHAWDKALGALFAISFSFAALTGLLYLTVCLPDGMAFLMAKFAPPASSGLPAAEYQPVCRMICGYLRGDLPAFCYSLNGIELFHDYEAAHMADCLGLYRLDRTLLIATAAVCLACAISLCVRRSWASARRGVLLGSGFVMLVTAALVVWGLIDFDSLFTGFHRLMFTNDLWLLNPSTDLLLRLMPINFFVAIAAGIAVLWLILTLLPVLLCFRRQLKRR